ncbi:MAG: MBL fold metallo-hydrolase [Gemmatimonadota bacterium]|nr:MAG: MBL fold metallo-hydrolase [Gemmatimonadota bacterium]
MTLSHTFKVGNLRCRLLHAGRQMLDGGAMFGVVPKPLWERRITPDSRNRIPLALRCLLVEHDAGPILVDTGIGNKEKTKFLDIYGVENSGKAGPTQLEDALAEVGIEPGDIALVINTHLHFDHCGGNTYIDEEGKEGKEGKEIRLAFPNASYVVQRGELEFAQNTNERTAASYLAPNHQPIAEAGKWRLVDGGVDVLPGIRLIPTPGHVPYHQSVLISDSGETACYLGDLVPTSAHVPLPWIMGYDLEPLVTLETKRTLLSRAEAEDWMLVFEHDPEVALGRVRRDEKGYVCVSEAA